MEALILPTQLSAQMLTPGGDAAADAASTGNPDQAGIPVFFAALLAQQLGIPVAAGQVGQEGEVGDAKADSDVDTALIMGAEADAKGTLGQLQQGFVGVPILPSMNAATAPAAKEDLAAAKTSFPDIGATRGLAGRPNIATDVAVEAAATRQTIAADSAAFADVAVQANFSASSEALAEQAVRPITNGAQPIAIATHSVAGSTSPVAGAISQPVSSPAWGDVLGERVMWMVGQQQQGAELRLNPPALGPLEIKLNMNDGQATLTFSTQHLPVKEALEAATPRLREMFGESGINLGSVSVNLGSGSQQQGEPQHANRHSKEWQAQPESNFTSMLPTSVIGLGRNGMVDFFA